MCHHRGEIPEWTSESTDSDTDESAEEELPEFLNEDGDEVSVLTDGGE